MLLLVTDTSGKHGFVALAQAGDSADQVMVIEEAPIVGGTFSAQLVPQIAALLEKNGFAKADISAFIVVSGPGSFTGLRVGLAAIKALAEILQKPIVPVSLLEVIALASGKSGKVLAALDAGRGEVFAGEYLVSAGTAKMQHEQLIPKNALPAAAEGALVSTADVPVADAAQESGLNVFRLERVTAEMIAELGRKKLAAHETVTPDQLDANYIRRSDAEIFAKASS